MKYFSVALFSLSSLSQAFSGSLTLDRFRLCVRYTASFDMSFCNVALWLFFPLVSFFHPLVCCSSPNVCIHLTPVCMPLLDTTCCWHINWIGNYSCSNRTPLTLQQALLIQSVLCWFSSKCRVSILKPLHIRVFSRVDSDTNKCRVLYLSVCVSVCVCHVCGGSLVERANSWGCF